MVRYVFTITVLIFVLHGLPVFAEEESRGTFVPKIPSSSYLSELAQMNVRYQHIPEAILAFEMAIERAESGDERGRNAFSLGQVLIRVRQFDQAVTAFQTAMEAKPEDQAFLCKCHTFMAQCLLQLGKPDEAEASLRFVVAHSDNDFERNHARDQLFALLIQGGRSEELVATVQEQFGTDTNSSAFLLQMAAAYAMQEDGQAQALEFYGKVLEKEPENREALDRTIGIYRTTGRFKDATILIERLFDAAEGDRRRELADRAAVLSRMGGDMASALRWQEQAVELAPDDPVPLIRLAETQVSAGKRDEGIESYSAAVERARSPAERDQFTLLVIREQVRAGRADDAEKAMRRLATEAATDQVKNEARRMLFEHYAQEGRLGEIVFPTGNQPPTKEVKE